MNVTTKAFHKALDSVLQNVEEIQSGPFGATVEPSTIVLKYIPKLGAYRDQPAYPAQVIARTRLSVRLEKIVVVE